jgi:hypothetical protein
VTGVFKNGETIFKHPGQLSIYIIFLNIFVNPLYTGKFPEGQCAIAEVVQIMVLCLKTAAFRQA